MVEMKLMIGTGWVAMADKVLVVEDEPALLDTLIYNLNRQGYQVESASDGEAAVQLARQSHPDLIVLDIMLPKLDGFEVCRIVRAEMNVPIIMLTARDDEIDRVIGLEMGADDYMSKPFSMRELMARVKAQLRRVRLIREEMEMKEDSPSEIIKFSNLSLDLTRREVSLGDQILQLKPKEFDLLLFLARHRGQVLSREMIMDRVWGWDFTGGSRTVDVHMRWLREKIEPDPAAPSRIITVRGAGYRFEG
jgi:DNA-binding response OmpR family regulator